MLSGKISTIPVGQTRWRKYAGKHVKNLAVFAAVITACLFIGPFPFGIDLPWAGGILGAFTIMMFVSAFVAFGKREKLAKTYRNGQHLPERLDIALYFAVVFLLAANFHWVLSAMWFCVMSTDVTLRRKALGKE